MTEPSTPKVTVLFRFRDLIAETLQEHRAIIDEHGACWWGWWKRPTEDIREEIWDHLEDRLKSERRVPVGLFDSGASESENTMHLAWVTEIKRPEAGHARAIPTVSLSPEDLNLVPEYYRKSVFSRGWLKLDEIVEHGAQLLPKKFSYDTPPPLPGIDKADLARLEGKTVADRVELRAMDTTIWSVREWRAGDPEDRFLSSSLRVAEPASAEPIRVRGKKILHLSDLHFGHESHRSEHHWGYPGERGNKQTLSAAITAALSEDGNSDIGMLIITGDFTFLASAAEFEHARHQISALMGTLDLGPNHVVLIPGNHDIEWSKQEGEKYERNAPVDVAPEDATRAYREFYKLLLRHDADPDLCMGRRFLFDSGCVVDVCALNSSSLAQGKDFLAGMGQMPSGAFKRIAEGVLGWKDPGVSLRLLAMHHHVVPTEDVEDPAEFGRGFGMANDAQRTMRRAAKYNVGVVLHGHRHRTFVWRSNVYALPDQVNERWELGAVNILGCGSTGSSEVPDDCNYFNVLTPHVDRLELDMYRSKRCSDFEPMKAWEAPLSIEPGRGLVPGPWSTRNPDGS